MADKAEIRKKALLMRNTMTREEIAAGSAAIVKRLADLEEIRRSSTLMVYLAFGSEVLVDDLIRWGWKEEKRIVVPLCDPVYREMAACRIDDFNELEIGRYGIRAPKADSIRPVSREEIETIVIPAVAFDRRGYRVGYGGGYYDRFLPKAPYAAKIGAAFTRQIVAEIPADPYDVPMDMIVTEAEIIIPAGETVEM